MFREEGREGRKEGEKDGGHCLASRQSCRILIRYQRGLASGVELLIPFFAPFLFLRRLQIRAQHTSVFFFLFFSLFLCTLGSLSLSSLQGRDEIRSTSKILSKVKLESGHTHTLSLSLPVFVVHRERKTLFCSFFSFSFLGCFLGTDLRALAPTRSDPHRE